MAAVSSSSPRAPSGRMVCFFESASSSVALFATTVTLFTLPAWTSWTASVIGTIATWGDCER